LNSVIDRREDYAENKELLNTVKKLNDELNKIRKSELQLKLRVNELISKSLITSERKVKNSRENGDEFAPALLGESPKCRRHQCNCRTPKTNFYGRKIKRSRF
jgi:hypothetical protein